MADAIIHHAEGSITPITKFLIINPIGIDPKGITAIVEWLLARKDSITKILFLTWEDYLDNFRLDKMMVISANDVKRKAVSSFKVHI